MTRRTKLFAASELCGSNEGGRERWSAAVLDFHDVLNPKLVVGRAWALLSERRSVRRASTSAGIQALHHAPRDAAVLLVSDNAYFVKSALRRRPPAPCSCSFSSSFLRGQRGLIAVRRVESHEPAVAMWYGCWKRSGAECIQVDLTNDQRIGPSQANGRIALAQPPRLPRSDLIRPLSRPECAVQSRHSIVPGRVAGALRCCR